MPHLVFRGIRKEDLVDFEKELLVNASDMINCPIDHFTVEWQDTLFISNGIENNGGYPFVNIFWFKRPLEQEKAIMQLITDAVHLKGYKDVCIYFHELNPKKYYENGISF